MFKLLLVSVGLVFISLTARFIILGGKPVVSLSSTPALAGSLSSELGSTALGQEGSLPQINKDYTLKNVRYFYNQKWVVAKILPVHKNADPALVVLEKINGVYRLVLGPAGDFARSYTYVLPKEVGDYLNQQGVFSGI